MCIDDGSFEGSRGRDDGAAAAAAAGVVVRCNGSVECVCVWYKPRK
jgi:hypothetical protein